MYIIALFVCTVVAIVIGIILPKKSQYNKFDKVNFIFNITLSVLYVPISVYGIFAVFASDSMFMYSQTIQNIINALINVGLALPFVAIASIVISVVLRKIGKRLVSFLIQFMPLLLFLIMNIAFAVIYKGVK